ncbi:ATPase [Novosphingobium marinum]|uniref:Chaperone required for assembly of F1-ATPase n=1 Tax=Novosphingobium marinum TaxID=1514948 RepID=A0A7Y9XZZ5_9SPHN|nr:ATP12 family protein [Novosphingobium marinum]NYH96443.1 chaperone required for assembly of F1-ATPase [Novosphingobium marinum]GGC35266.1 ATPase [Novosphingobium marinum]
MKRFWKVAEASEVAGGWQVHLDGRGVKTVGGRPQAVPTRALAEALAAEWDAQGEKVDPAAFPMRDLADYAIDVVAPDRAAAIRELLPYAETDTLCYRGDEGEALHARQCEVWDPLLEAAEHRWDVRFERVSGIVHRPQAAETLARMQAVLESRDAFALAALKTTTSLAASLVVGLTALEASSDARTLWRAAEFEADWQAELWGRDAEAGERAKMRFEAFELAMRFAALAGD